MQTYMQIARGLGETALPIRMDAVIGDNVAEGRV